MSESEAFATAVWEQLAAHVEAFSLAWDEAGDTPPPLNAYLPERAAIGWRLALIELIKIDLERRAPSNLLWLPLEEYFAEWPELIAGGEFPIDLVYEEYHVRKQQGEPVDPGEYALRFPQQASRLAPLLAVENPQLSSAVTSWQASEHFEPGQTVDDFDLIATLGQGAFATVFLARQRSLGRLVAVKISSDRGLETQTLARLDHPHIVRVFDQRRLPERGLLLMYMQYLGGGTLRTVVDRVRAVESPQRTGALVIESVDEQLRARGETPPSDSLTRQSLAAMPWPQVVAWIGARLCGALDHAHRQGVLHLDLKPGNVLLGVDCQPSLVDFNVSSCLDLPSATEDALFGGTIAYMSPEQLAACLPTCVDRVGAVDARSDMYSLAMLLWELLTGYRVFVDDAAVDLSTKSLQSLIVRRQVGVSREVLQLLPVDCPPLLVETLRRALAADRDARFGNAQEMGRLLRFVEQPELQTLLRPAESHWIARARRLPLIGLLIAGIVPNVAASAINIAYNRREIVEAQGSALAGEIFDRQLVTVNPLFYFLGIAVIVSLAWPILRGVRQLATRNNSAAETGLPGGLRFTQLGDCVAAISGIEWLVSGIVFPLWLHLELGAWTGLTSHQYLHFFASQSICGLLAATMAFFLTTHYSVTVLAPRLLEADSSEPGLKVALDRLGRRAALYSYLAMATFPLAMIVMPLLSPAARTAFIVLGAVGVACSALAYFFVRRIQRVTTALQAMIEPPTKDATRTTGGFNDLRDSMSTRETVRRDA